MCPCQSRFSSPKNLVKILKFLWMFSRGLPRSARGPPLIHLKKKLFDLKPTTLITLIKKIWCSQWSLAVRSRPMAVIILFIKNIWKVLKCQNSHGGTLLWNIKFSNTYQVCSFWSIKYNINKIKGIGLILFVNYSTCTSKSFN